MAPGIQVQSVTETVDFNRLKLNTSTWPQAVLDRYRPEYGNLKLPPTEDYEHHDPGKDAQGTPIAGLIRDDLTPYIGTEFSGRQLSSFTDAEKNELALLAAQRGVLVFKDQDFAEIGPEKQKAFVEYFGRLHIHPTSAHIQGHPEFHLVSRGIERGIEGDIKADFVVEQKVETGAKLDKLGWHTDVSYERQPVGTTFLWILENPKVGGDTTFASTVEAYNRLSPDFRKVLEGLEVTHSAHEQAEFSRSRGGVVRREPIISTHPLIRTHPVTGEKAIYVNTGFSRSIVGWKKEESDALLNFLYNYIQSSVDFQTSARWRPGTVVVWDNRVTQHTPQATREGDRRLIARLGAQAERPTL